MLRPPRGAANRRQPSELHQRIWGLEDEEQAERWGRPGEHRSTQSGA
jgi:hypothetical protein